MKVKILVTLVALVSLGWLGMSFAIPSEAPVNAHFAGYLTDLTVSAEHPDSHRLGAAGTEEVTLPDWGAAETGIGLALLGE